MERIGEILVARGVITTSQLEAGLRAQVFNGGRLGTNLVELYDLNLDAITDALAIQRQMPPALQKHFDQQDPEVAARLMPEDAKRFSVIPLRIGGQPPALGVACKDPLTQGALAALQSVYELPVTQGIAPELRILYYLERTYGIERTNRYRRPRPRKTSIPPAGSAERRSYAWDIKDPPPQDACDSGETALGKIAIKKMAFKIIGEIDTSLEVDSPEKCIKAMRRINDREKLGSMLVSCLYQCFDGALSAGLVFILRQHLAICWQGFARHPDVNLEGLGVPIDEPGVLEQSLHRHGLFVGSPPDGGTELDRLLWDHLRCGNPAEVVTAPIELEDQVGCLIYAQSTQALSDNVRQDIAELASGVNAAFRRLVRASER